MYKIIAANGVEYGPATAEQIRQWIAEGRVNAQTQVQQVGTSGFKPISEFPEFAASFARHSSPAPMMPPNLPGAASSPQPFGTGLNDPYGRQLALDKMAGPAIGTMVVSSLGLLYALFGFVANLFGQAFNMQQFFSNMPNQTPEMLEMLKTIQEYSRVSGIVMGVIQIFLFSFLIYAGLKMKKLESHGMCIAAGVIMVIPCIGPCCLIGIGIGIWVLVVLNKPEVKAHFS